MVRKESARKKKSRFEDRGNGQPIKEQESSARMSGFIRLLDSTREAVLDSVSVEYEDSFCLETFGDLAQAAYEFQGEGFNRGDKSFILARVQTWDHKQPGKMFFSYYNAFHLNKILFQTQVYLGKKLIHRLHVLNPLTNTDIIGNVQYFLVEKKKKTPNTGDSDAMPKPKAKKGLFIDTTRSPNKRTFKGPASATVKEIESGISQTWTLASAAVAVDNDEEHEGKSPVQPRPRKYSIKPRTSAVKPISIGKNVEQLPLVEEVEVDFTPLTAPPSFISGPFAISLGAHLLKSNADQATSPRL